MSDLTEESMPLRDKAVDERANGNAYHTSPKVNEREKNSGYADYYYGGYVSDELVNYDSFTDMYKNNKYPGDSPNTSETEWSDDESEGDRRDYSKMFYPKPGGNKHLWLGKVFDRIEECKDAIFWYSLMSGYDIKFCRSGSMQVGAICSSSGCPWRVYCSMENPIDKFMVKVYIDEHVCEKSGTSKMLKVPTIATMFSEIIRMNPMLEADEIQDKLKTGFNMEVSLGKCKKALRKALDEIRAKDETVFIPKRPRGRPRKIETDQSSSKKRRMTETGGDAIPQTGEKKASSLNAAPSSSTPLSSRPIFLVVGRSPHRAMQCRR